MSHSPSISVVIPTYNRVRQVQAAVESVLAQTYPEFEVIVIDDGSTDGTGAAFQQLIGQHGSGGKPVRYLFQPNQGQSTARNKGIAEARGEWIAFLDSDDVWLPEKLEWQMRAMGQFKSQCGACITDARLVDNRGRDTTAFRESGNPYAETLGMAPGAVRTLVKTREPFWVSTLLVRADVLEQAGGFDPDIHYAEDHDFLFRLSLVTSFCYVNKPLSSIDRSESPQGSTCRPWDQMDVRLRGSQLMFEKWLKLDSKVPADVRKAVVKNLRETNSAWTNWYLQHGRYEEARQAAFRAIKYQLTSKLAIKWMLTQVAPGFARRISPKMRVYS